MSVKHLSVAAVVLDRGGLWLMLGVTCAIGVAGACWLEVRRRIPPQRVGALSSRAGALVDVVLGGLAAGMTTTLAVLILARLLRAVGIDMTSI